MISRGFDRQRARDRRCAGAGRRRTRAGSGCTCSGFRPTRSSSSRTRCSTSSPWRCRCSRSGAPTICADALARVQRRERVLEDHLQLAAHRRAARAADASVMSRPRKRIVPAGRLEQPHRACATSVVLPQPDSPTIPSVSPSRSVNDTSSTACTLPTVRSMKHALLDREVLARRARPRAAAVAVRRVGVDLGRLGVTRHALRLEADLAVGDLALGRASRPAAASSGPVCRGAPGRAPRAAAPRCTASNACGQRGRKWQPCGGSSSDGGRPGIAGRRSGRGRGRRG